MKIYSLLEKMCQSINKKSSVVKESWNEWIIYKFDNGLCFAFRQWSGQLTHYTTFNGWYGYKDEYDLPKNADGAPLFKSIDWLDYQMRIGTGFTIPAFTNSSTNNGQNTSNCVLLALTTGGGAQDSWVTLQVYGRWK